VAESPFWTYAHFKKFFKTLGLQIFWPAAKSFEFVTLDKMKARDTGADNTIAVANRVPATLMMSVGCCLIAVWK
jgi:hypothetical protein